MQIQTDASAIPIDGNVGENDGKSYSQILKSTTILGGSSIITILLRILRTKVLAVLLGPAGVGLMGIYDSITVLVSSTASLGIGTSGVRQIAEANVADDSEKMSQTIVSLRRVALITGFAGSILFFFFSGYISRVTFGNLQHADDIVLLSITILFTTVSGGQVAIIQGLRRIKDIALLNILGALAGSVLSILIIYHWGEKGIAISLIMVAATKIISSWYFSRKIVPAVRVKFVATISTAKPLIRLGMVFMSTSLMALGTMYIVRVLVVRFLGLSAAGMYQAAIALSSVYVGFILDAMGRDYFPRLTSIANNNDACISLVNKQLEIGLLLAIPGILATLTFAPLVIELFYSSQFAQTYEVLRWLMLGVLLRIASWPLGFLIIAKGNGRLFFYSEVLTNAVHLSLIWFGIKYFGLVGTGMAFFIMYIFYCILIFGLGNKYYKFKLSPNNLWIGVMTTCIFLAVLLSSYLLPNQVSLIVNACLTAAAGLISFKRVIYLSDSKIISNFMAKLNRLRGYFPI